MTIKEMPLIKAASKLGAHPKFLFAHPILIGVVAVSMCTIFGGVAVVFVFGWDAHNALEFYNVARVGGLVALILAGIILVFQAVLAIRDGDEVSARLLYVLGGFLGIVLIVILDWGFVAVFGPWLAKTGPIIPSALSYG